MNFSRSHDTKSEEFIEHYLKFRKKAAPPSQVTAFLCWPPAASVRLYRRLSSQMVPLCVHNGCSRWPYPQPPGPDEMALFLVDGACHCAISLLDQANASRLFDPPNTWLILHSNEDEVSQHLLNDHNLDTQISIEGSSDNDLDHLQNQDHKTSLDEWDKKEESGPSIKMGGSYQPGDIDPRLEESTRLDVHKWNALMNGLNLHVGTQMFLGIQTLDGGFLLVEVYRMGRGQSVVWQLFAEWGSQDVIRATSEPELSRRRMNLHLAPLRVVVVVTNNDTLQHFYDIHNKHIDSISKMGFVLARHAVEMLNASLVVRYDPSWGYMVNGSWDGIVGYLQRDEADLGGTAVLYTSERAKVIHYLLMTTPTKLGFVFRQPPLSTVRNVFTMPFSGTVWISSAALLAVCGLLLYAALQWERLSGDNMEDPKVNDYLKSMGADQKVSWSDVVLLSVGAVCQQGSPIESRGTPGRIISLFLFIVVIFLYTSYSACIVALLQSSTNSIKTLKDLLHSRLDLAVEDIIYNRYFFEKANEPIRRAIYQKRIAPKGSTPRFIKLEEGVAKVKKGMFAFHFEVGTGYKLVSETFEEDEKCGLTRIPYIQVVDAYLVIQKRSVYKEIISVAFRKLQERGFQSWAWNRFYTKKPECISRGSSFMSVGLIDCYPAMLVLVYGAMCSIGVLVLEILVYKSFIGSLLSMKLFVSLLLVAAVIIIVAEAFPSSFKEISEADPPSIYGRVLGFISARLANIGEVFQVVWRALSDTLAAIFSSRETPVISPRYGGHMSLLK
uniref:Ionotropic glutamate receptor C-terminal domain-containing protein n=1 Tax=Timema cristinae TaxID=61476 RepID=A0A7R9DAD5_TIMCR|nr:unnamed protein product [Timema cristinae]